MKISAHRVLFLTIAGLVPVYVVAAVYIDPQLKLLMYSGVLVALSAVIFLLWRIRRPIRSWYGRMSLRLQGAVAGCFVWCMCFAFFYVIQTRLIRFPYPIDWVLSYFATVCGVLAWPVRLDVSLG